jgi:hypothetical protein
MDIFDDTIDTSWLDEMLEESKKKKVQKTKAKKLKLTIKKS